jgi:hypothetical protein
MIWAPVKNYEGIYEVSRTGLVRRLAVPITKPHVKNARCRIPSEHILTPVDDCSKGYLRVRLYKRGQWKTFRVHRLVASAYIPNPHCKREVNHKDGIKTNNNVNNLEWSTSSENFRHAIKNGLIKLASGAAHGNARAIDQFSLDGKYIKRFDTIKQALDSLSINGNSLLSKHLKGTYKTAYGYTWRYAKDPIL